MKVTCQQCGTAYSVADSKVAGRKVKLRCKQCNDAMIIDGTAVRADAHEPESAVDALDPFASAPSFEALSEPPAAAAADTDAAQDEAATAAAWHIAIGDETQGPYSLDEVAQYYAEGRIGADTLVYCDGAADWQPARENAALTHAAAAHRVHAAPPPVPTVRPVAAEQRRPEPIAVPMGRDPFEERVPATASSVLTAEDMLSSTRHEGTVQFSLDQIRAISAVSAPSVVQVASMAASTRTSSPGYTSPGYTSPGTVAPGYASGEGSGLINVSALNDPQQLEESPFHVISNAQRSPLDAHTPFGVLTEPRTTGVDTRTKVFAGLSAFGFVLVTAVAVIAINRTPAPQPVSLASGEPVQAGMIAAPVVVAAAQPVTAPTAAAEPVAAAAEPVAAAEPAAAEEEPASAASTKGKSHAARAAHPAGKRIGAAIASAKAPAAAAEPKEPKEASKPKAGAKASASPDIDDLLAEAPTKKPAASKGGSQSIDDLLDSAVSAKKQPPKAEPAAAPASNLPASPSKESVLAAFGKAKTKTAKCKGPGVATADVTITGSSGRATSVNVTGVEGAAKTCVENAIRGTAFPKFQKDSLQVKFPFKLGE